MWFLVILDLFRGSGTTRNKWVSRRLFPRSGTSFSGKGVCPSQRLFRALGTSWNNLVVGTDDGVVPEEAPYVVGDSGTARSAGTGGGWSGVELGYSGNLDPRIAARDSFSEIVR